MASEIRVQRIAQRIREKLSEMLLYQLTDPRLTGVIVTDVTVDREMAYAKVYVFASDGSTRRNEALEGLRHAEKFLRYQLSQDIELRSFPQLRFKWDATAERAERMEELFASLKDETPPAEAPETDE
jgi:ribosome-binding factor A